MDPALLRDGAMGFERTNGNGNGSGLIYDHEERENGGENSPRVASLKVFPVSSSSTSASSSSSSSSSPRRYIEHHVTKYDTLAGIAIRYGVEVADIKKMNGLVTDLQMFGLKTLQIPLPGRHPPSPCLTNGHGTSGQSRSEQTPRRTRTDLLESFHSLRVTPERNVSPAMSTLQGYYGLTAKRSTSEGCEMAVYSKGNGIDQEDEGFTTPSLINPPLSHGRRSRSMANGFKTKECYPANDAGTDISKWIDKLSRQRQKSEADFTRAPEKVLKEESSSGGWFSAITGKGLALRSKAASRTNLASDAEVGGTNGLPPLSGDTAVADSSSAVRKSSSTSSLQEQDNNSASSIWSSLKPDIQAALGKPLFDGLSKPITGRRAKAALD